MLSRAAQGLAQAAPAGARTAATAAVKRPAFVPRARTASSPATSTAARSAPAAAVKAAQPVTAGSSTVAPPVKSAAPEPLTFDVLDAAGGPPGAPLEPPALDAEPIARPSFVRSTPHNPFAASTSLPAGSAGDWAPAPIAGTAAPTPDVDWSTSFHGMSAQPYSREQAEILMRPLEAHEIEIKPGALAFARSLPSASVRRLTRSSPRRRSVVPPRDSVPTHPEQGVRPGRVGHGPARRDDGAQEPRHARMGARRRRAPRLGRARRAAVLRPERDADRHRGVQEQRAHALLQGFGHRERALVRFFVLLRASSELQSN